LLGSQPSALTLLVCATRDAACVQPVAGKPVLSLVPSHCLSVQLAMPQDGSQVMPALEGGLKVDALLLDIQMKELNGDVVCSELRARGDGRVVIAVTGS
jgi:CheY-like chemotaxis protein